MSSTRSRRRKKSSVVLFRPRQPIIPGFKSAKVSDIREVPPTMDWCNRELFDSDALNISLGYLSNVLDHPHVRVLPVETEKIAIGYEKGYLKRVDALKWMKRFRCSPSSSVIVPINLSNSHWVLLYIPRGNKYAELYDTAGSAGITNAKRILRLLGRPEEGLVVNPPTRSVPKQTNGVDCGPMVYLMGRCHLMGRKSFKNVDKDVNARREVSLIMHKFDQPEAMPYHSINLTI